MGLVTYQQKSWSHYNKQILNAYNNTKHSALGNATPQEAITMQPQAVEHIMRKNLLPKDDLKEYLDERPVQQMEATQYLHQYCRILMEARLFEKRSSAAKYSRELFYIYRIRPSIGPMDKKVLLYLKDLTGEPILGVFTIQEIKLIDR